MARKRKANKVQSNSSQNQGRAGATSSENTAASAEEDTSKSSRKVSKSEPPSTGNDGVTGRKGSSDDESSLEDMTDEEDSYMPDGKRNRAPSDGKCTEIVESMEHAVVHSRIM